MTSWPAASPGRSARFSASVWPVTVRQSPFRSPFSSRYFITAGHAADLVQVLHDVATAGLQVGDEGHAVADRLEVVDRQRHVDRRGPWRSGAARRWSSRRAPSPPPSRSRTPSRVMMSRGLMSVSSRFRMASPARKHSSSLPASPRAEDELYGQRHAEGLDRRWPWCWPCTCRRTRRRRDRRVRTMSWRSSSLISPARNSP